MQPHSLAPNLIDHFYRGGDRIAALRHIEQTGDYQPEEWIAATVSRADQGDIGLARTTDGALLRDLVTADPAAWIGTDFDKRADAADTGILVKLLDARQRLPVHVHPERDFARSHLDCPYGKTEAWYVLATEPGAAVHLGWKDDVDPTELAERRDAQDSEWMLSRMNRIEVSPGMGILVPAGTVHAIDAGIFVAEVQEPTDFSIVLEWSVTTSTREESHLGLGFDTVMTAVSTRATTADDLAALVRMPDGAPSGSVLPPRADRYFRLDVARTGDEIAAGFAAVIATGGDGTLDGASTVAVADGAALAVPADFGPWRVGGNLTLLVFRPGAGWPASLTDHTIS